MASKSSSNSGSASKSTSTSKSSTTGNYSGLGGMDSPSERNGRGTAASSPSSSAGSKSTSTSASKGTSPSQGASASVSLGGASKGTAGASSASKSTASKSTASAGGGAGLGAGAAASIGASRMGTGRPSSSIGAKASAGASAGVGAIGGPSQKTSRVGASPSMQTGFDAGRFSGGPLGQQTSAASYSSLGGLDSPSERTGRVGVASLGTGLAQAYGDLAASATSAGISSLDGKSFATAPTHRQAEIQSMDSLAKYEKQVAKVVDAGPGWTTVQLNDGTVERRYGPASRAARNFNPGNIEASPFTRSVGAIGTDGRFAVFPDRQTGINAISSLLGTKNYRDKTVQGAIATYAPAFENNTARYASTVAKAAGVSLDTKLSDMTADQRSKMVNAMMGVEGAAGYKTTVQTEGKSYGQPATPGQKASMPSSSDPSTLGSLRSPDYSKQPAATEGQQQIDRAATPAKQSFRDKYLGTPDTGPVPGAKPQTELTTGQKIAAGAIDVASSMIPGVGSYIGLANAGLSLTGNKTLGQQLVGSFADGSGTGFSSATSDQGGSRNTIEAKTDDKAEADAKAAAEPTTAKPAERFISTYLRPTPREKWSRA